MKKMFIVVIVLSQTLTSCFSNASKKDNIEDFRNFLVNFSTNEAFQMSRIVFPLEYITLNEDFDTTKKVLIERGDWRFENIFFGKGCSEIYPQVYDNFKRELKDSGERVLTWKGIENGIAVFYYFKASGGKWFLVKKEDFST